MSTPTTYTRPMGKRGTLVIPAPLRQRYRLEEGNLTILEATKAGILIRPAVALPVEEVEELRQRAEEGQP